MTLTLKPTGKGNWKPLVINVQSAHLYPLFVRVGDKFTLGGVQFRIAGVMP